nr:Fic family protein [Corynebacterium lactis]
MTQKDRWEKLLYPGTNTLRNIQGVQDESAWQQIEGNLTSIRAAALPQLGFDGSVRDQLCQTHAYLFQDCYEWAGTLRTVDMSIPIPSNPGTKNTFAAYTTIPSRLAELDEALVALDNASYEDKVEVLAYLHSELNEIHPFREGNGRSTRAFFETVAARHDVTLTWEGNIRALHEASVASMSGDRLTYEPFHRLYQAICEEATFDEAAKQSIFDVLGAVERPGEVDPLAFAHDAFPRGLQAALSWTSLTASPNIAASSALDEYATINQYDAE